MSITHCISLPSFWEQQGIFTFNRPWAALLQHNWWRKDGSVTFAFLDFFTFLWMNVMAVTSFQACFSHYHPQFFLFFPFCGSKPNLLLLTNDLLSAAQTALMLFVLSYFIIQNNLDSAKYLNMSPSLSIWIVREMSVKSLNFDICLSTLLYWVFLCIKNMLVWQHIPLKALIDCLNRFLSQIEE